MNQFPSFSHVANTYLREYYSILNEMIRKMSAAVLTYSISHNFIVQMIPHHQAAIQMSQNLLNYTTNIPLQTIAEHIISEQTKSIANMESILCSCSMQNNSAEELTAYQAAVKQITDTMFFQMAHALASNEINISFIHEMIPHHEGAVNMSENVLRYPICSQLKPIVEAILISQEQGIRQMQYLLLCIGGC